MGERYYEFDSGFESDLTPLVADPSDDQDLINYAFADGRYARCVSDLTALKAVGETRRGNNLPIFVLSLQVWFIFNSASVATADDIFVIQPNVGSGRWLKTKTVNSFTMTNGQGSAANINGLSFDGTKIRSAIFFISLFRDGTVNKSVSGQVTVDYDGSNWNMGAGGFSNEVGLVLSITSGGQVQYTLDSNSGSTAETFRWKILELIEV